MSNDKKYRVYNLTDSISGDYLFECFIQDKTINNIIDIYKSKPPLYEGDDHRTPWALDYYNNILNSKQDIYYLKLSKWAKDNNLLKHPLYLEIDFINQHDCVFAGKECFNFSNIEDPASHLFARECELLTTLVRDGKELGVSITDRQEILNNIQEIPLYDQIYNLHAQLHGYLEKEKINNALTPIVNVTTNRRRI